jgi:hypothetical protein
MSTSVLEVSFQCALETLSNQWCSAQDSKRVVELKLSMLPQANQPTDNIWEGIQLLDRETPVLARWLEIVKSGVEPSDSAGGNRLKEFFNREQIVKSGQAGGLAAINEKQPLFDSFQGDRSEQWNIFRTTIKNVMGSVHNSHGNAAGPYFEILPGHTGSYFLLGLTESEIPKHPSGESLEFDELTLSILDAHFQTLGRTFLLDMSVIRTQFAEWVKRANRNIDNERSRVITTDPVGTLDRATSTSFANKKISPLAALTSISNFIKKYRQPLDGASQDTIEILDGIVVAVQDGIKDSNILPRDQRRDNGLKALVKVFQLTELQTGIGFIRTRIEGEIKPALEKLIENRNGIPDLTARKLLAANDVVRELEVYAGTDSLTSILISIDQAGSLTRNTITSFVDMFQDNIKSVLESYVKRAKQNGETANGTYTGLRTNLCLKLLSAPIWPKKIPPELCSGLQLKSKIPGGPPSIAITRAMIDQARTSQVDYDKRACAYRNYLRNSDIYQWRGER